MTRKRVPFPETFPERAGAIAAILVPKPLAARITAWLALIPAPSGHPQVGVEIVDPTPEDGRGGWQVRMEWAHPRGTIVLWWRLYPSDRHRSLPLPPTMIYLRPGPGAKGVGSFPQDETLPVETLTAMLGEVSTP